MGVFLKHIRVGSCISSILYLFVICFSTGHRIYFSSPIYLFFPDYCLMPEAVTSANLGISAKKITAKCLDGFKKAVLIRARTPLLYIHVGNKANGNDRLLLLDSYQLVPVYWYTEESCKTLRKITVEDPYKLDAHAWCTLYYFINKLPEWLYDHYTLTWYDEANVIAYTQYKTAAVRLKLTAFSVCDEQMKTSLERIYTALWEEIEQKAKQQRKSHNAKPSNTVWSVDARYDNRFIVKRVEGGGVT